MYKRLMPDGLDQNEGIKLNGLAQQINRLHFDRRVYAILVCLINNALLVKEVNQLREEKGIKPIKTYDPMS
jgi:hypothetical protein